MRPSFYLSTGTWGDPTLATNDKGRVVVEAVVAGTLRDIEVLQVAAVREECVR